MPDWVTHICFGYLIACLMNARVRPVILGSVLPDLSKLFMIFTHFLDHFKVLNFFLPFHTIFGSLLSGALISSFFKHWKETYLMIIIGLLSHFALDSLLYPFGNLNEFFYPLFTFETHGFIWSDSYLPAMVSIPIAGLVWLKRRFSSNTVF
ncbi:MAG: hypothetical protein ACE5K4_09705 [Candidatus Hydrothermarchaeota archaeon]